MGLTGGGLQSVRVTPIAGANLAICGNLEKDFLSWYACFGSMGQGGGVMELRHLRYFIAGAETGSLTLAAERRLHTSQPSLSLQIGDVDDPVGVELMIQGAR